MEPMGALSSLWDCVENASPLEIATYKFVKCYLEELEKECAEMRAVLNEANFGRPGAKR